MLVSFPKLFKSMLQGFRLLCRRRPGAGVPKILSALLAVMLIVDGQAFSKSDDSAYPVDATLMRAPAHKFMTPAVNVKKPVKVAIVKYVRPAPNEEIVPASVKALEQYFGQDRVRVSHLSLDELAQAASGRRRRQGARFGRVRGLSRSEPRRRDGDRDGGRSHGHRRARGSQGEGALHLDAHGLHGAARALRRDDEAGPQGRRLLSRDALSGRR